MKKLLTITKEQIYEYKKSLQTLDAAGGNFYFNDIDVVPEKIKAVLINEVVPQNPDNDFYGKQDGEYLSTAIPLFQNAGIAVNTAEELLDLGIYITNAVKKPKSYTAIERSMIEESLPFLEKELSLFPNVQVIMLMGDVAKKAMNMIAKRTMKRNVIPAVSTYKLRHSEIYYKNIRLMPSYIMTGKNILIEKSKFQMASEDISNMIYMINDDTVFNFHQK